MKLLIGADLVPTKSNQAFFAEANVAALVGEELLSVLKNADYRIFNLEVPLTDKVSPIKKCGPALIAPTDAIAGYKALGVDLLTIANNHIMDHGEQGLDSTMKLLDDNGIAWLGAGENLKEAEKPYIIDCKGKKIGIYACAEHEFSIAGEASPGANPFDPLESPDHVAALKQQCDYVIVLYHGGKEHYRYPSPNLQKTCRKLVEKGADLVVCQHSHCIGCEEKHKSGTIVYGQGNFLFDCSKSEYWQTSLLIQIDDDFTVSYIPLVKQGNGVRIAQGADADAIMAAFHKRSQDIKLAGTVREEYARYVKSVCIHYLLDFDGVNISNILFRVMNRLTGFRWGKWIVKSKYTKERLLAIRNYIDCESHRELVLESLKNDDI